MAERTIQTYKNHLISGLFTCDSKFPAREWDRLLTQCNITINLLISARCNPSLSAHAAVHGNYDFNTTPMVSPVTKVVVHKKADNRKSWTGYGTEVWYIGPSLHHYRYFKCYMPLTCSEQDTDTVEFSPTTTLFPRVTTDIYLCQVATDLQTILQDPKRSIISLTYGSDNTNAYVHLAQILKRATTPPMAPK